MYSSTLLDHFEHPRNSGELPKATARARVENPVCADVLELAVSVRGGVIEELRFKAQGCVPTIACASMMTELARGKEVDFRLTAEELAAALGGVPTASTHAAQLAVDVLRSVLRQSAQRKESAAHHG